MQTRTGWRVQVVPDGTPYWSFAARKNDARLFRADSEIPTCAESTYSRVDIEMKRVALGIVELMPSYVEAWKAWMREYRRFELAGIYMQHPKMPKRPSLPAARKALHKKGYSKAKLKRMKIGVMRELARERAIPVERSAHIVATAAVYKHERILLVSVSTSRSSMALVWAMKRDYDLRKVAFGT